MNVMLSINQVGASKKGAEASFIFRTQNSSNKVTKALFSVSGASTTTICPSKNIYHDDKNLKGSSMCMYWAFTLDTCCDLGGDTDVKWSWENGPLSRKYVEFKEGFTYKHIERELLLSWMLLLVVYFWKCVFFA